MNALIVFEKNERRKEIRLRFINAAIIQSSWKMLTDTAEIVIPKNLDIKDHTVTDLFKNGDKLSIFLGYNGELNKEFTGYIQNVNADIPVTIKCEDSMFLLKKQAVNVSYRSVTLKQLLKDMSIGFKQDVLDVNLGKFRAEKTTVAKVLEFLQDEYSIYSYFIDETLMSGKVYSTDSNVENYKFEQNVITNDLKYINEDDVKVKITAGSIKPNGDKLSVEVGDEDGVESSLLYPGVSSEKELKQLAELDLEKLKKSGYEGSITAFGIPYTRMGDHVELISSRHPEREGRYHVDAVSIRFNDTPEFRRILTLGKQVG